MELKQKLSGLRKDKGLTQLELAELLAVSRQAVSRWEVGTAVPSLDNLVSLSEVYGVPLDYLVHDGPKHEPAGSAGGGQKRTALLPNLALILCVLIAGVVIGVTAAGQVRNSEAAAATSFQGGDVLSFAFLEFELRAGSSWMEARPILREQYPQLFPDTPKPVPVDGPVGYLVPIG